MSDRFGCHRSKPTVANTARAIAYENNNNEFQNWLLNYKPSQKIVYPS
ncbi:hypothetical protein ACF3DV_19530 [Chlorogloeopsis fritschii PCC 9212]|nr:hypothetical protein [Chlorogloeopsis fritschii]